MVRREIVLETVKKMYDSGLDDATISETLKDIGLSESEIGQYLSEAKGKNSDSNAEIDETDETDAVEEENPEQEIIAQKTAQKVMEHLDDSHEEIAAQHAVTQSALEGHSEAISKVHENVSELHDKLDKFSSGTSSQEILSKIIELNTRISNLEKQLGEIKAVESATKSLLEKIFETNRSVLNELERK